MGTAEVVGEMVSMGKAVRMAKEVECLEVTSVLETRVEEEATVACIRAVWVDVKVEVVWVVVDSLVTGDDEVVDPLVAMVDWEVRGGEMAGEEVDQ